MRPTRFITLTALYSALLICVQLALSGIAGVELVTVFLLAFCFIVGIKAGVTVAVCFSLLRCLIFGFYPSVITLYLIYYSTFSLFFGAVGKQLEHKLTVKTVIIVTLLSTIFTACFTLLDDVITPLFYGFSKSAAKAYFVASLPFMLTQCVCTVISVSLLFMPLGKTLNLATKN